MGTSGQTQIRRLLISGYYGFRNSGDEAVLRSILLALEEQSKEQGVQIQPVVLSADPDSTSRMYGVEAVARMSPGALLRAVRGCDGLISGGGSLLQDATGSLTIPYYTGIIKLAQWFGKPTFIYAQGIGPVGKKAMYPLIRSAMKRSAYVSVRDAESAALLGRIGVPEGRIEIVPDPVMGMPLPAGVAGGRESGRQGTSSADAEASAHLQDSSMHAAGESERAALRTGEPPLLGISLRHWRSDGADLVRAADALIALSKRMPVRLRFLPFHTPSDTDTSKQVLERLRGRLGDGSTAELAADCDDPQQMLLEVSRCDALFGMRLHALIYAANQNVPMLGLSYDPKIDQFLLRLGLQPIGSTERLDAVEFADAASSLLQGGDAWLSKHKPAIDLLKQQSQKPAQQIVQLLRHTLSR